MKKILEILTFSWVLQTIGRQCINSYLTQDYITCARGIILIVAILISIQTFYFTKKITKTLISIMKKPIDKLVEAMNTALQE